MLAVQEAQEMRKKLPKDLDGFPGEIEDSFVPWREMLTSSELCGQKKKGIFGDENRAQNVHLWPTPLYPF